MSETQVASAVEAMDLILGHRFQDQALAARAITHASWLGPQVTGPERLALANERLEFVGDALLGAALCVLLHQTFADSDEGQLSRWKARLASRSTLARLAEASGLLAHCRVAPQMVQPWPDSVKANLAEAILAAVHFDGGWEALVGVVGRLYATTLGELAQSRDDDAKSRLQCWCLGRHRMLPAYVSERTGGSDHAPEFTSTVSIGEHSAIGQGGSRRRAEVAAAEALLLILGSSG